MPNLKIATLYYGLWGLAGVGILGIAAAATFAVKAPGNPDYFQRKQVAAVVRQFEGSPTLDGIIRSQGLEIRHETLGVVATVNVNDALANACQSEQFISTPVCTEYGEIQASVKAPRAETNAKYGWMRFAFGASAVAMAVGLAAYTILAVVGEDAWDEMFRRASLEAATRASTKVRNSEA